MSQQPQTVELLFAAAEELGLKPKRLTQDLFSVNTKRGPKHVHYSFSSLNSHISTTLAKNKYLTRMVLAEHQLPNIPFCRPNTLEMAKSFLAEHGLIIVKPLRGMGAEDVRLVTTAAQLQGINFKKYIFEKFIAGKEFRYLVLNNQVIGVQESLYGTSLSPTRELERISYEPTEWDQQLVSMSQCIAAVLELRFAAVDYIITAEGQIYVLEVNCVPGFKWFHSPTSGPPLNLAQLFLQALIDEQAALAV